MRKIVGALVATAGLALAATSAQALPFYNSGSFAISGFVASPFGSVDTQTVFPISGSNLSAGPGDGDMAACIPTGLLTLSSPSTLDFGAVTGFGWTNSCGTFTASTASLVGSPVSPPGGSAIWDVEGSFTVGAAFSNAGDVLSANELWAFGQTGAAGSTISGSATFFAPSSTDTPEPATLALFGAGLAGLGAMRRRRKTS